jgi:MinD-like ATPase involved in chromosome partitioning or flagellar assembly
LLIRMVVSFVVCLGATAYRNRREAVMAVNIDTRTPTTNTRAKPVMTEVEPN